MIGKGEGREWGEGGERESWEEEPTGGGRGDKGCWEGEESQEGSPGHSLGQGPPGGGYSPFPSRLCCGLGRAS